MNVREGSPGEKLDLDWSLLFAAWMVALLATAGSLFFSYVMEFAPCVLCWYQRIFMYPQAVILGLIQIGGFGMMTAASLLAMLVNSQLRMRSRLLLQAENRVRIGKKRERGEYVPGIERR